MGFPVFALIAVACFLAAFSNRSTRSTPPAAGTTELKASAAPAQGFDGSPQPRRHPVQDVEDRFLWYRRSETAVREGRGKILV